MAKIYKKTISNSWNEGMTSNLRGSYGCTKVSNFFVYPDRLVERRGFETMNPPANNITHLHIALDADASGKRLYAMVNENPTGDNAEIYHVNPTSTTPSWTQLGGTLTNPDENSWLAYHDDYVYFVRRSPNTDIVQVDNTGTTNNAFISLQGNILKTFPYPDPIIHPSDTYMYIADVNKIHRVINGTAELDVLALDANAIITSICAYGDFLAIFYSYERTNDSFLVLWDRDSSNVLLDTRVAWSSYEVIASASLDGTLVAVTLVNDESSAGQQRIQIHRYTGNGSEHLQHAELVEGDTFATGVQALRPFSDGDRLYFAAFKQTEGATSFGNHLLSTDAAGVIRMDLQGDESTIDAAVKYGDMFIWSNQNQDVIKRTAIAAGTWHEANYETDQWNGEDSGDTKQLRFVRVGHAPLPTGATVTIGYREVNPTTGDYSFTTIVSNSTAGSTRTSAAQISGVDMPQFSEIVFQIKVTGGVTTKQFYAEAELIEDDVYNKN